MWFDRIYWPHGACLSKLCSLNRIIIAAIWVLCILTHFPLSVAITSNFWRGGNLFIRTKEKGINRRFSYVDIGLQHVALNRSQVLYSAMKDVPDRHIDFKLMDWKKKQVFSLSFRFSVYLSIFVLFTTFHEPFLSDLKAQCFKYLFCSFHLGMVRLSESM